MKKKSARTSPPSRELDEQSVRMKAADSGLWWLWLAVLVVVLDQLTKAVALANLELHQPVPVAPFFNLMLTFNTGAAFSLLSEASGWQRWFFAIIAVAVSVMLLVWLRNTQKQAIWTCAALTLILGGALGNLWDRLARDGAVVDFVSLYYQQWHWPAFNVADTAICIGAAILLVTSFAPVEKTAPST